MYGLRAEIDDDSQAHQKIPTGHRPAVIISNVDRYLTAVAIEMGSHVEIALNQFNLGSVKVQDCSLELAEAIIWECIVKN